MRDSNTIDSVVVALEQKKMFGLGVAELTPQGTFEDDTVYLHCRGFDERELFTYENKPTGRYIVMQSEEENCIGKITDDTGLAYAQIMKPEEGDEFCKICYQVANTQFEYSGFVITAEHTIARRFLRGRRPKITDTTKKRTAVAETISLDDLPEELREIILEEGRQPVPPPAKEQVESYSGPMPPPPPSNYNGAMPPPLPKKRGRVISDDDQTLQVAYSTKIKPGRRKPPKEDETAPVNYYDLSSEAGQSFVEITKEAV